MRVREDRPHRNRPGDRIDSRTDRADLSGKDLAFVGIHSTPDIQTGPQGLQVDRSSIEIELDPAHVVNRRNPVALPGMRPGRAQLRCSRIAARFCGATGGLVLLFAG